METKKVHLGLDLGIASVGWSLVDSEQNIIAMGSHLFKQASIKLGDDEYGEGIRGQKRRARRTWNRKKQRKLDFLNMIDKNSHNNKIKKKNKDKFSSFYKDKYQKIFGFNEAESVTDFLSHKAHQYDFYKIYREGFERELNPKELFLFLYQKLSFRGVFFIQYKNDSNKNYSYETSLLKELEKEEYKYRIPGRKFSIYKNWEDINFILNNCSYIDEEFVNDYKKIFFRHREYAIGPGGINAESKWGLSREEYESGLKLWDKKIGFCPVALTKFNDNNDKISNKTVEKKLNYFYFIGELANLISQLITTKINDSYLSYEQIIKILNSSIKNLKEINLKNISKWLNKNENDFSGFPKDSTQTDDDFVKNEKLLTYFKVKKQKNIISNCEDFNIETWFEDLNEIDKIRLDVISKYWNQDADNKNINFEDSLNFAKQSLNKIEKIKTGIIKINYENFVNLEEIHKKDFDGTRRFGFQAYKTYFNNFFKQKNLSRINVFYKNELKEALKYDYNLPEKFDYLPFIPLKMFNNQSFISPNAKNTLREAIRVIDYVFKNYIFNKREINYVLESIILETTWEDEALKDQSILTKAKKIEIAEYNKFKRNQYNTAKKALEKENEERRKHNKQEIDIGSKENKIKYVLWKQQDCRDFYTGDALFLDNIEKWEVDHIIPKGIWDNNKLENKVVTMSTVNGKKTKKTPFEFLSASKYKEMKEIWKSTLKVDDEICKNKKNIKIEEKIRCKKYKLLTIENIDDKKRGFLYSSLSDTTYAIRKFKEGLKFFIKNFNDLYSHNSEKDEIIFKSISECKIRTVSGNYSQKIRNWIKFEKKDRSNSEHHAHDATFVALFSSFYNDFVFFKQNDYGRFLESFDLSEIESLFEQNKEELKRKIKNFSYDNEDKKIIFTCKKNKLSPKINNRFYNLNLEKQLDILKTINAKKLFKDETFKSYKEIGKNKYKISYINLINGNNNDKKAIFKYFKILDKYIKEGKTVKNFCEKNNVLTSYKIIKKLYDFIILNNSKKIFEDPKNEKKDIFKITNDKVDKSIFVGLSDCSNKEKIFDEWFIENLMTNYVLILKNQNEFLKIKKIKVLFSENKKGKENLILKTFVPTFELKNKKNNNKSILNENDFRTTTKNQALWGETLKMVAVITYKDGKKDTTKFFKFNHLNEIVRGPKKDQIKKVEWIDPNIWYEYKGSFWQITKLDITDGSLTITNKSKFSANKSLEKIEDKSYSNGNWKEHQELFNKIMRIKK